MRGPSLWILFDLLGKRMCELQHREVQVHEEQALVSVTWPVSV